MKAKASDKIKSIVASHPRGRQALKWAEQQTLPIQDTDLERLGRDGDILKTIGEQLWEVFTHKFGSEPADFRRNTKEGMELEIWRKLEGYYHPKDEKNAANISAMLCELKPVK